VTIKAKDISSGRIPTFNVLPRSTKGRLVSAVETSFAAKNRISKAEAKTPKVTPKANVATVVTVVVTEDIITTAHT
jgi:hypothetical protein